MDKERIIIWLWGCITVILVSSGVIAGIINTIMIWKPSDRTIVEFDVFGIGEIILVFCGYGITKMLCRRGVND